MKKSLGMMFALAMMVPAIPTAVAQPAQQARPAQQAPAAAPFRGERMVGPALYVSDMVRSVKFYTEVLGMKVRAQYGVPGKSDTIVGFGTDMNEAGIMLLFDRNATAATKIEHGHGFNRLALTMSDLKPISAKLTAAGYKPSPIREVHGAATMMMVTDPDGYRLELIGPKP